MKNLLKVSSLSVLAVLCSANAWADIADSIARLQNNGGYTASDCREGFYHYVSAYDMCIPCDIGPDEATNDNPTRESGYYCPGVDGYELEQVNPDFYYQFASPGILFGRCRPGETVDLTKYNGTDGSECVSAGPTLYNDTISESCKADFLGSSSGNALNSFAAEYTPNNYTVSLHSNYGTDTVLGTVTATYDAAMPTATAPSRVGYTFNGFYDATTGGTQYYTSNMTSAKTYDKTANTNLYAYWDVNSHSITFSCGTMTGTIPNGTTTYDSNYTFPTDSACEHTGYTFNGWGCSNDTTYTSGQSLTWNVDSDLECSAEWTANTITISWDPANGNDPTTNTCTYDSDITLPTAPTKTGYTFSGWKLVTPGAQ